MRSKATPQVTMGDSANAGTGDECRPSSPIGAVIDRRLKSFSVHFHCANHIHPKTASALIAMAKAARTQLEAHR